MIQTPGHFYGAFNKYLIEIGARLDVIFAAEHVLFNAPGAAPTSDLKLLVSPSGRISIRGSETFWKTCYFEFSPFG